MPGREAQRTRGLWTRRWFLLSRGADIIVQMTARVAQIRRKQSNRKNAVKFKVNLSIQIGQSRAWKVLRLGSTYLASMKL